jgi:hypothetical protein
MQVDQQGYFTHEWSVIVSVIDDSLTEKDAGESLSDTETEKTFVNYNRNTTAIKHGDNSFKQNHVDKALSLVESKIGVSEQMPPVLSQSYLNQLPDHSACDSKVIE